MDSELSPHGRTMSQEGEKLWVQRQLEDVQYREIKKKSQKEV